MTNDEFVIPHSVRSPSTPQDTRGLAKEAGFAHNVSRLKGILIPKQHGVQLS